MVSGGASPNSREGDDASIPDPAQIETLPQLAAGLNALRQGRSYEKLDRAVGGRKGSRKLPPTTVSDMVNGKSVPSKETMVTFLTACGLTGSRQEPWLAAWERVDTSHLRRPDGAVRVRSADPRVLGVHASIQVDPGAEDLPAYVPRDVDADLRAAVAAARDRGGFVLVKGSSSVGKTRALFEAVEAVYPEWWLLHPIDAAAVRAFADAPTPRTVVWLDELQRYLTQPGGIPVGTMRALLAAKLLVVATLWPGEYTTRTALRTPGQDDQYAEDRQLLGLARIIEVTDTFSPAERQRAEDLAADQRIRVALNTTDAGITQVLAAGPELIRWWEHADPTDPRQCLGKAVITAALDARRVGANAPLTRDFPTAAAPAYLPTGQRATAPPDWLDQALGYATTRLHGATACLTPIAAGMGQTAGWATADYLYQHARTLRRTEPLPEPVWQALVDHHHPNDIARLADNADRRDQLRYAASFYRHAAEVGDWHAAARLVEILIRQGQVDGALTVLRRWAKAGHEPAARRIPVLLARSGQVEEAITILRDRVADGDRTASEQLADILAEHGRVDELRTWADDGEWRAAERLADLLVKQGRIDELRSRAEVDYEAAYRLVDLFVRHGRLDELHARADAGDAQAAYRLADLLAKQDHLDEAVVLLRDRVNTGDAEAANRLADLLADHDRLDEALAVLEKGTEFDVEPQADRLFSRLAEVAAQEGRLDDLRAWADNDYYSGSPAASHWLASLLVQHGHEAELRARSASGDFAARRGLAILLARQGNVGELRARADTADEYAAEQLAILLMESDRIDDLRRWADAGSDAAAYWLVDLLAGQGRLAELEQEVRAGTLGAANRLQDLRRASERAQSG
jgi:hypothetical protein